MIMSVFFLPCVQLRIQYAFRVQHPANIALLVIAAHFQVPLPLHVPMESSPCEDMQTVQSVQLDTCAHPPSRGLFGVHLAPQHLERVERKFVVTVLLDLSVQTQSE